MFLLGRPINLTYLLELLLIFPGISSEMWGRFVYAYPTSQEVCTRIASGAPRAAMLSSLHTHRPRQEFIEEETGSGFSQRVRGELLCTNRDLGLQCSPAAGDHVWPRHARVFHAGGRQTAAVHTHTRMFRGLEAVRERERRVRSSVTHFG